MTATTQLTVTIQGANDSPTVSQVTGAVAAYDFENGSGTSPSVVSGAPNMTIGSGVSYNPSAGRFSGSTGLLFSNAANSATPPVSIASIPNLSASNAFSFGAWVRFDQIDSWARVFDFGGGTAADNLFLARRGSTNDISMRAYTGSTMTGEITVINALAAQTGNWMHLTVTVNSSNQATVYVNGSSAGSATLTSALNYSNWTKNLIGASNWTVDMQFRGAMDDISIFDKALSAGEVATLASTVTAPTIVNKSIAENSANGTNVFDARSSDVDSGDGVTYSILSGNTNSTFAIGSTSGQVTVANSSMLNFEANSSYTLVIRAADTAGLTTDQTVTVTVADVNEAPSDITLGSAPTGLTTAGNTSLVSGTTYQLTAATTNQAGAVWNAVNLAQDFTITSRAYLGASDAAADGITFALQNQSATAIGSLGIGLGAHGISSAFGIALDTYTNPGEPNSEFSQFFKGGVVSQAGSTTFDTPNLHDNLEDAQWHDFVVSWNATSKTLSYSLDGVSIDSKTYDVVATDWGGNANGFFGFTGGTGGAGNQQQIEIISVQTGSTTSVAENATSGTVVGVAAAVDPDRTGTVTYSLTDNAGGRFAINSSTGQITVASGAVLDAEVNSSHRVVVQSTDQGGSNFSKTFTINVANVNEAPVDVRTATQSITVTNPSFEANVLADGAWAASTATGWTGTGTWGVFNPSNGSFPGGIAPDGSNIALVQSGTMSQVLLTNFDSSLNYSLTVDVVRRLESGAIPYSVQLLAGSTVIGTYSSTNADLGTAWTINIDTTGANFAAANGGALQIVLSASGGQTNFDNVRLMSSSATASIAENSANNTVVTTVTGLDRDAGNTLTYSLTNNAGGRFAINSTTGQITVADGSLLNFESASSHNVVVRATDQNNLTFDRTMTINLTNVNEAPNDMGFGTQFVGDASTLVSANSTVAAANDFTLEIKATPRETITLVAQSNSGINAGANGGMAVMADQGDGAWGTSGAVTRSVGLAVGTNGIVVYQHSSSIFSSLLTYTGTIQPDSDIAVVFVNKTPTLFVNGVQVATGIQSDGTTVRASVGYRTDFGVGGGAAAGGRYFNGTLSDYRVWNSALDATTINNNRTTAIATGTPGLLANMIASSVNENSANGTVVGRARGYDPDSGATFGYTLSDNAGGRFTINNTTGEITVANSSLLDFETNTNHTVTIRTTDQSGLTYDENVTIRLRNVNETPTAVADTATAVEAGGISNGTAGTNPTGNVLTNDTDTDSGDTKIVSGVVAGTSASASGSVGTGVTGTFGSINIAADGSYTYTVDNSNSAVQALRTSSNTLSDVFTYTMRDTAGATSTTQITVTIQGANDTTTDVVAARYLSTLTPISQSNIHGGGVSNDIGHGSYALALDGVSFARGIGTHAPSSGVGIVDYAIDGATQFKATIGINDYVVGSFGSAVVKVYVDGVLRYTSPTLTSTTAPIDIAVDTTGGSTLRLEVGNSNGTNNNDHATWYNARLEGGTVGLSVAENAANNTVVGSVNRIDADWGDNATYTLTNNAGGRFAINSSTGQITVANGSLLNFEDSSSHAIVVQATDAAGAVFSKTMAITVTNVNEAPTAITYGNVIADYRDDFRQDAPLVTGWQYLWNAPSGWTSGGSNNGTNAIGNPNGYVSLLDSGSVWTVDGDTNYTNDTAGRFAALWATGGHPGVGTNEYGFGASRAVIGAFTIATTGAYSITDSFFQSVGASNDGLTLYVHVDGNAFVETIKVNASQSRHFNIGLGTLTAGQTVYVVASPDGTDGSDSFVWDYSLRQESSLAVAENASNGTVVTTVRGIDEDIASAQTYSLTNNAGGRFAIDGSTGVITVANGSLLDFETSTNHQIVVRSTDGSGSFLERTLTINLTNANEGPVAVADSATAVEAGGTANGTAGTNPTGNVLTNDTDIDAGDTKTVSGVVAGTSASASGSVGAGVTGTFGSINIAANGAYAYTVDNSNAAVQALRTSSNTLSDVFTYTMRDTAGATSTTQITVTIQGANDAPSDITGTLTIAENSANATSVGTLSRVDIDSGDGATFALTDNSGGRFAINSSTGQVTVANGSLLNFEANTSHTIVVQVTDTALATFSKTMTVTVADVNDMPPVNSTPTSYSATEDTAVALTGLSIADADGTHGTMTVTLSSATGSSLIATSGGDVTVSGSGTNALILSGTVADINAYLASASRPTFTAAADFNGSTWITMLTSDNGGATSGPVRTDRDVISVSASAAADAIDNSVTTNEETPVTFAPLANDTYSGSRTITSINGTAITAGGSTVAVTGGSVGLDVSGQLTYTPNSNYNGNNTFTYSVQSTTNGAFTAGRLDYEFYNTSPFGSTVANIPLSGGNSGVATDFNVTTLANTLKGNADQFAVRYTGLLNVMTAGTYQFWIGSDDGGAIFINGEQVVLRDGITAFGESTASTTLAAGLHSIEIRYFEFGGQEGLTANYSGADTSSVKTSFFATPNIGTFGTVTTTETATVSMSVTNVNDAPTAVADTATALEAGGTANATAGTNPTGNLLTNDTDIDAGDTKTVSGVAAGTVGSASTNVGSAVTGTFGSINIAADGIYTYTVNNSNAAVQALRTSADTLSDVFTYTMRDAAGLTSTTQITVTIQGANDAPTALSIPTLNITENSATGAVVGSVGVVDPDAGDSVTYAIVVDPTWGFLYDAGGRFLINSTTGEITVKDGSRLNFEVATSHSIQVRATDASGASVNNWVTIGVTNVNEAPIGIEIDSGNVLFSDNFSDGVADGWSLTGGFAVGSQRLIDSTNGLSTAIITAAGASSWTDITMEADINFLDDDESGLILRYQDANNYMRLVVSSGLNSESGRALLQRVSGGVSTTLGTVFPNFIQDTFNGEGNGLHRISFSVVGNIYRAEFDGLDLFGTVTDSTFASGTAGLINNFSTNSTFDNIRVTSSPITVTENASNGTVVANAAGIDWDAGTTLSYTLTDSAGGRFAIDSSTGVVTVADGSLLNFESNTSHVITIEARDQTNLATTKSLTISVSNVNENPIAVSDTATAIEAGGISNATAGTNPTGNVLTNDTDVDAGDTKTVTGVLAGIQASAASNVGSAVTGTFGSINIAADGSYTYTVDNNNAAVQALRTTSNTLSDVFTYTVRDTAGLTSTTQITVTIQGANDAPSDITGTLSIAENSANTTSVGTLSRVDIDAGDGVTYALTDSAGGRFAINSSSGQVTVADGNLLNFETNTSHTIVVQVTDTALATFSKTMTVTVTDMNEAPVLDVSKSPVLISVSETGGSPVGAVGTLISSLIDFATPSGQVDNVTDVDADATTGVAITSTNANYGTWWYSTNNGTTWLRVGNVADTSARLLAADANTRVYFEPTQSTHFSGTLTDGLTFRAWDRTSGTNGGTADTSVNGGATAFSTTADTAAITINNVNDAPRLLGEELITNGSFDTDLTGWTTSGTVTWTSNSLRFGTGNAVGPHTASQTIATVSGRTYELSFDYRDDRNNRNQSLVVTANGTTSLLTSEQLVTDVVGVGFVRYTYSFVADSSSTTITLTDTSNSSGLASGTNGCDGYVDSVSVRQMNGSMGAISYTENDVATAIHPTVNLADLDSTTLTGASIQFTNGFNAAQDALAFANQLGISGNYNATTGVLTLSGTATVADYQTALRSITYQNISDAPTASRTISFTVNDGTDTNSIATRDIAIVAVNDAPTSLNDIATAVEAGGLSNGAAGTNPTGNVLTNDTDVDAGDSKTITGVVAGIAGSASTDVASAVTGTFGSIHIAADGSYTYTVDNGNVAVQALRTTANTLSDVFTYTMRDAAGLTSTTQITVTIQGANDAPTSVSDYNTAVEAGGVANVTAGTNPTGNVLTNDTDPDSAANGETRTVTGVTAGTVTGASGSVGISYAGTYGSINIAASGAYTYTVDNTNADVQALRNSSQTLNDVFTYTMTDASGATSTTQVTITIQGANDAPVAVADTAIAVEAGGVSNGTAGTNPNGNVMANDTDDDSSANGETKTVVGILAGTQASASGNVAASVTGTYGSINIAADGSYTYTVDNSNAAVQALRTTANTLNDVFTYTMQDAAGATSTQQITVNIQGANDTPYGLATTGLTVAENAANSTTVGTIARSDLDASDTPSYSLTDDAGGRFAINSSTGVVTVANSSGLNYEMGTSHNITVRVTDLAGAFYDEVFTVNLTDVNEFGVTAPSDIDANANAVDENVTIGTVVGITASASDSDATTNTVTYSLFNNDGGNFAIDANTGVVTTAVAFNRETLGASRNITIRATSSDGSVNDTVFTININDLDEFDVTTPTDSNLGSNNVDENVAIGTTVGVTANAFDLDSTTNTITYSLTSNVGGLFQIDANTGVVTTAAAINREIVGSTRSITVQATSSDGSTATQTFNIAINDLDEFDVGSVTDSNAASNTIAENSANGTIVHITGLASDPDATTSAITYSLDNDAGGRFAIDSTTGLVTVADSSLLNYEAATSHGITIRATSADNSYSTQNFTINLTDVNESAVTAISDINTASNSVLENTSVGTVVGVTALATDADGTDSVSYSLDDDAGGRFAIDATTGVVTVAGAIDREEAASYNITIRATSTDSSTSTSTSTITIADVDEFDVSAIIDSVSSVNSVSENASIGTTVGITALASDSDATTNGITYSLTDNDDGRFAIDATTGVVTVAGSIDRELHGSTRMITVRATSADSSYSEENFAISIVDVDEFDVTTATDSDATSNNVDESVTIGTTVGITANSTDSDATTNGVTYSLFDDDGGNFAIDANTGVVTTAATLNRETLGASRSITVRATSVDGSTADTVFTININDLDEFDVTTPTDSDATSNNVDENISVGTTVGITADAFDLDSTTNTITYSLTSNVDNLFQIDPNTGVVTTAAAINREVHGATRSITVQATSSDGSTASQMFNIAINDLDKFDVTTPTDSDATSNNVDENVSVGTTVGITANAFDLDSTTNAITYSLTSNVDNLFQIDANTGVVTTAAAIDRETHGATRSITVQATSSDGSTAIQTFNIAINDLDEFDVSPVTDSVLSVNSVSENASIGTTVGITALASDSDATTNGITYSLTDNDDGRFAIDATTGVVTVAGSIDRELHGSTRMITVRATSADTSYSEENFSIDIVDVDEFDVSVPSDTDSTDDTVDENVTVGTTVGITANAFDLDSTTNAITYSLTSNVDNLFQIDPNTGVVTTAVAINREVHGATRSITVQATSSDGSTASQTFNIAINDLDEFDVTTPTDSDATSNNVDENISVGTTVGITADAFDLDSTTNTITYSLTSNVDGLFQIDVNTGVVTTAAAINREIVGSTRSITVQATSSDGSTATQTFNIAINDLDEFDVGSVTDSNAASNTIAENSANGTIVHITGLASDPDATTSAITYSLDNDAGGRFAIDSTTGVVTVADGSLLNFEAATSHGIVVRATSADSSYSTQNFTINLTDVNESAVTAISDINTASNSVLENTSVGTVVGVTALATDADGTDSVSYSLDDDAGGRFAIDATTGVVTVAGAIDREEAASYNITIRATSTDSSTSTSTSTITIADVDEFDVSAIIDSVSSVNSVSENASIGTTVGITALASDSDATTNGITYSLTDNDDGRFAIDATTGVVTVAGSIDRELHGSTRMITVRATSADSSYSEENFAISIVDVDEFDVTTATDSDATTNNVDESVSVGTTVGITANAFDLDSTTNAITYSLTSNVDNLFQIDANTGVVTTAAAIIRETHGASRSITVQATSSDGSTATQIFTIAINDLDEFDVTTPTDLDAISNNVDENVSIGTTVGITANAFDLDSTTNAIIYSLTSNVDNLFQIDPNTGVVTTAAAINRETHGATRSITVQATSSDGSTAIQTFNIAINDLDEFDVSPVTDSVLSVNSVSENAAVGTTVGITALASDSDATTNGITYSLTDNDDGRFAIDATTGVVTVAGSIDRELHGSTRMITVQATSSDGSTATQTFNIAINDLNEFDVTTPTDSDATSNNVDENVSIGTTVGITANAFDLDATTNTITYSLTSNVDNLFQIDPNTGVVTTAAAINREVHGATRSITVQATSSDGSVATQTFTIAINDLDEFDVSPVTDSVLSVNSVSENAAVGTTVGITALASDSDATTNGITYSLTDNDDGRFAIDATTGVVTVAGSIDRELHGSTRNITVRATSADTSYSEENFTIDIVDVDEFDVTGLVDSNNTVNYIDENLTIGTLVGITAFASDADATTNLVLYSLDDDAGGRFAIDSLTGVVSIAGAIDREEAASYTITIRATSDDLSTMTMTSTIEFGDIDEFDVTPIVDLNSASNSVAENSANGTVVGITADAFDADATDNVISYSLIDSAGGRFAIDSVSGLVRVANGSLLNFEASSSHVIRVQAASTDGSTSTRDFTIAISDVNERPFGSNDSYSTSYIDTLTTTGLTGVIANDGDPDGNALTSVLISGPSLGSFVLRADGSFTYVPVIAFTGSVTFVYVVTDGELVSEAITATIVVITPLNVPGDSGGGSSGSGSGSSSSSSSSSSASTSSSQADAAASSEKLSLAGAGNQDTAASTNTATTSTEAPAQSAATAATADVATVAVAPSGGGDDESKAMEVDVLTLSSARLGGFAQSSGSSNSLEHQHVSSDKRTRAQQESHARADALAPVQRQEQETSHSNFFTSTNIVNTALGTGIVLWVIQGAQILAAILSTAPALIQLDPLSVLPNLTDQEEEEPEADSAGKLFDKK